MCIQLSNHTVPRPWPFRNSCGFCWTRRILDGNTRGISRSGRWRTRTTRCCRRRWRNGRSNGLKPCCRATWRSFLRSTAACSTVVRNRFPGDEERVARVSLVEEGHAAQSPDGQSGHCRIAQHQRRGRHSFQVASHDDGARTWPSCFPSGSTTRPTASRHDAGCCWPTQLSHVRSPMPSATDGSPISAS